MKAIFALLFVSRFLCLGQITHEFPIDYAESEFLTNQYRCVLMKSDFKNSPRWNAEKEILPLNPTQAASLAIEKVEALLGQHPLWPHSPGWDVARISLTQTADVDIWYYKVELKPRIPGSNSSSPVTLFVTFDRKVLPLERKSSKIMRKGVGQ